MLIWPYKGNIIKHENLSSHIKMGKEILTFWDIKIEKKKKNFFYHHEISTVLKDVDIEKVLVFNKILSCEKKL